MEPNFTPHTAPTELRPVASVVTTRGGRQTFFAYVRGRRLAYVYEPRCHVCTTDPEVLEEIHGLAADSVPVARILKTIGEDVGLSNRQLRQHLNRHVPEYALYERAVRSAATAFGDDEYPSRVNGLQASQIIIERGTQLLAEGRLELKATDVLAAARFQHDMELDEHLMADAAIYSEAMMIVLGKFYKSIGPARFNEVMWSLSADPRMSEIMRVIGLNPASVIDAEATEENPVRDLILSM